MEALSTAVATPTSVLLVDSDTDTRRALQLRLRAGGLDVRAYASGWSMLADAAAFQTNCIVVRDRMSEIDGFEVLSLMRLGGWRGPAILLTAMPSPELALAAKQASFTAVVDRPLVDDFVLHAVDVATRASSGVAA